MPADGPHRPDTDAAPRLIVYATAPEPFPVLAATGEREWMTATTDQVAYRCPPLVAANLAGWQIHCPHDFVAVWNGGVGATDILIRGAKGLTGVSSVFGNGVLTIDPGCTLRTDPGIDLLVTGPLNAARDGVAALSAIIEADWMPQNPKISYVFTRPGMVRFKRGEAIAQILPMARGLTERMKLETKDAASDPSFAYQRAAQLVGQAFLDPATEVSMATLESWWGLRPPGEPRPTPPATVAQTELRGDDAVRSLASLGIYCHEAFLDDASCAALTACFQRQAGQLIPLPDGNDFFDNRVLWLEKLPPEEAACAALMRDSRRRVKQLVGGFFNLAEPLYSDTIQLVKWEGGQPMRPHADNANPDGTPHRTPYRAYAAIVYLNEDYDGGVIHFPNQKVRVAPRRGLLVAFSGGLSHMHGVTEVTRGVRYTMPSWYTFDPRFREPADR